MNRVLPIALSLSFLAACGTKTTPAPPACASGLTLCGSVCVDLALDGAHCGQCETACTGDTLCAAGVCEPSCGGDRLVCGSVCVAYLTDPRNCGKCAADGGDCIATYGSSFACETGRCQIQCSGATPSRCGSEGTGFCTDLSTDDANCGACGNDCASLGTNFQCEAGICQIQCSGSLSRCGSGALGTCVDLSTPAHCGNCTVACDTSEACRYGLCTTVSPSCSALLLPGPTSSPATANPVAVGAADFNDTDGLGLTDLVIAEDSPTYGGRLLRLDGRGDGTFAPPVVVPFTLASPSALVVGRFDPDANDDLLVASSDAATTTLHPLYGDGAGVFTELTDSALDAGAAPQAIALADLNQDLLPDLIVGDGASQATANLRIFLNDGTGLFGVAPVSSPGLRTPNQILDVGVGVRGVAVGDIWANGDSAPDVVVVWDGGAAPGGEVLLNNGAGVLTRPTFNLLPTHRFLLQTATTPPAPLFPTAVAVADLNGDGLGDWAVAHAAESAVTVVLAAFATPDHPENGWAGTSWVLNDVAEPRALLLRDFDADARPDLVTVNASAGAIYFSHNSGPAMGGVLFDPPVALPVGTVPVATALAPVAAAGAEYFFTVDAASADVVATESLGGGFFEAPIRFDAGVGTSGVALADVDESGSPDVALADASSNHVELWLNPLVAGGTRPAPIGLPAASAPVSIVAGVLDADTHPDLAVSLEGTAQVGVLWGNGDGTFSAPQYLAVGSQPEQVIAASLNGDALPDLVTADMGSDQVTVLLNLGSRTFDAHAYPVGAGPRAVAALRLGPAACDSLVTANATAGTLSVLPCDAGNPGQFLAAVPVPACAGARALALGDFDADGQADVAVACDAGVAIFHAPGNGTLESGALFDAGGPVRSVSAADVNADGWIDLVAAVPGKGGVTVLHGARNVGFSPPTVYPVGGDPLSTVTADLDGDSRIDVCAATEPAGGQLLGAGAAILFSRCQP